MDKEIENLVALCSPCAAAAKSNVKGNSEFLASSSNTFNCIHRAFSGPYLIQYFLNDVGAHSENPGVIAMSISKSRLTVAVLPKLRTQHGFSVSSDNHVSLFPSPECTDVYNVNSINHKLSRP